MHPCTMFRSVPGVLGWESGDSKLYFYGSITFLSTYKANSKGKFLCITLLWKQHISWKFRHTFIAMLEPLKPSVLDSISTDQASGPGGHPHPDLHGSGPLLQCKCPLRVLPHRKGPPLSAVIHCTLLILFSVADCTQRSWCDFALLLCVHFHLEETESSRQTRCLFCSLSISSI